MKALPNDGKSIQRKKEGTKMKKRDPEAQGGAFERRKMHEEGAGLFVAPMMPEKANREVAKTTRKNPIQSCIHERRFHSPVSCRAVAARRVTLTMTSRGM